MPVIMISTLGRLSQIVFEDYVNFVEKVHEHLPDTKIMFIPIKTKPQSMVSMA